MLTCCKYDDGAASTVCSSERSQFEEGTFIGKPHENLSIKAQRKKLHEPWPTLRHRARVVSSGTSKENTINYNNWNNFKITSIPSDYFICKNLTTSAQQPHSTHRNLTKLHRLLTLTLPWSFEQRFYYQGHQTQSLEHSCDFSVSTGWFITVN